jgi:ABC-type multidrug transport system fused ATPase/permease subunit
MCQPYNSMAREFGDSESLCSGTATAESSGSIFEIMSLRPVVVVGGQAQPRHKHDDHDDRDKTMDESRSSTPEPPQDLWSSILDSVSSTRSIPSKHVLLLGQSSSGKSTLANALLGKPAPADSKNDQKIDYALGYDYADVRDDADEGVHLV